MQVYKYNFIPFQIKKMEYLQGEIEKLLGVITVILLKLSEIENNVVNDVRLILDKSKNEVALIQKSIIEKYKLENSEDDSNFHTQTVSKNYIALMKAEDIIFKVKSDDTTAYYDSFDEVKPDNCNSPQELEPEEDVNMDEITPEEDENISDSEEENDNSAIKISFKRSTKKINGNEMERMKYESFYSKIRKCNQCDYKITGNAEFKEHMKNVHFTSEYHTKTKLTDLSHFIFHCKQCNFSCKDVYDTFTRGKGPMIKHICDMHEIKDEEGSSKYQIISNCDKCDFSVNSLSELRIHLMKEHSTCINKGELKRLSSIYQCNSCEYSSKTKCNMMRHIETRHELSSETCHICGLKFKSKESMSQHIKKKHYAPEGQKKCEKCMKCFKNEDFDGHVCEKEKFICNTCGRAFLTKYSLIRHNKVEHEHVVLPKPFICDKCDFCCETKYDLKSHMLTHEEKTPCPECGERVRHMKAHMKAVHTPDELQKYQCQDCGKGFHESRKLEIHRMNVHLKLRPYNCRYGCDISYNDTSNRNQHEKKTHGKLFTTVKEEKLKARMQ